MFLTALSALVLAQAPAQKPFEFKDGDRIVWIGNTLVEREQRYGYWETALLVANADKKITVRNLGWSGDTVHAEARGRFDFANPDMCLKQLVNLTLELKPTVIFICYGTNESFEGKEGLPKFEKGLNKLLDSLKPSGARIVLFTPVPFETLDCFPEAKARNAVLGEYAAAIRKTASARNLALGDLFAAISDEYAYLERAVKKKQIIEEPLTENGMHLTETGYLYMDWAFVKSLGQKNPGSTDRSAKLRQAVIAKNELFFHRWRPQNETYLFGFRKHEQGKNAKEVAEFDPLVAKAEEEIERIRKTLQK